MSNTPEEKAKELIEKFKSDLSRHTEFHAKQCAAICVKEIIEALEGIGWPTLWSEIEKQKAILTSIQKQP